MYSIVAMLEPVTGETSRKPRDIEVARCRARVERVDVDLKTKTTIEKVDRAGHNCRAHRITGSLDLAGSGS